VEQKSYLTVLSALLLSLLLSSCSWDKLKRIEVKRVEVDRVIPTQNRPREIDLNDITWFVVTDQNFNDFKKRYTKQNGNFLFYAMSVRDYETLALNMAEIKRYIEQQKQIIIYYEKAVAPRPKPEKIRN
jgi:leucyl aminopeptidase (aminopeptidase T)